MTLVLAMLAAPAVAQAAPKGDALAQKIAAAKAALEGGKSMALIGSGPYWLVSLAGDDLFCLDAEASQIRNGGLIQLYTCNGWLNQGWFLY
jgi:hypothetical protein